MEKSAMNEDVKWYQLSPSVTADAIARECAWARANGMDPSRLSRMPFSVNGDTVTIWQSVEYALVVAPEDFGIERLAD